MRVAYLSADQGIPYAGGKGASIHVRAITAAIARLGHQVVCFVVRRGEKPQPYPGVDLRQVRLEPFMENLASGLGGLGTSIRQRPLKERELTGLLLNDAFTEAVARAHALRPFDLILERSSLWSYAGVRLARRLEIPCFLEVNAPLPEEQRRYRGLVLHRLAGALSRRVLSEAAAVLAVSREMARLAMEGGAPASRVHVIPNGFDPDLIPPVNRHVRRVSGSQDTRFFTIGFVGSLKPWHGIEELCRAFRFLARRHGAARLLLVGAGPMSDWVKRFALRSHLQDRIELTGKVPHSAVAGHLSRFHMAVAPYPQRERFYFSPLKLFEYMGSGLPVMATRTGQMEEILQHGRTAWLVPPGDPAALATGMARLAGDPALRRRLGQAARRVAFSRYRWQDVALRIMRLAGQRRPVCSVRDRAYPRSRRQEAV